MYRKNQPRNKERGGIRGRKQHFALLVGPDIEKEGSTKKRDWPQESSG